MSEIKPVIMINYEEVEVLYNILKAVKNAHSNNVIHRDIKPLVFCP